MSWSKKAKKTDHLATSFSLFWAAYKANTKQANKRNTRCHVVNCPSPDVLIHMLCMLESASLITKSWAHTLPISHRALGDAMQHERPTLTKGIMQFCMISVSFVSSWSSIGSRIVWILLGNALLTYSCRFVPLLSFSSVGRVPVIISNRSTPKL